MALDELLAWGRSRIPPYLADMFPAQRAFFDDPAKVKCAQPGRRAGKTTVMGFGLHTAALAHPRTMVPYITLSGVMARRIMWPVLHQMNDRYGLGMDMNDNEMIATLPQNGSSIFLVGGDNMRKVEALRGTPYPRVGIDEAGSFPRVLLRYLIDDVLDASLMDYDGDLWITGTPNAACIGHFYDLTTGKNPSVARVSTHHWTVLDNVHIPHAREWLERKRKEKRWTLDTPVYLREYMGQWVRDASWLVYRFDRARHMVAELPDLIGGNLGVDLGTSEKQPTTAIVASGWAKHNKTVYTTFAKKYPGMTPSSCADEIGIVRSARPWASRVVTDAGGLGKGYVEEWRKRFQMPAVAAEKKNKLAYIEILNGELDLDRVKLLDGPTAPLVEELEVLQWDEDRKAPDERFADHAADGWLYSWRDCYGWLEKNAPGSGPEPGSSEWLNAKAAQEKAEAIRAAAKRDRAKHRGAWWRGPLN